ncbi:hypothetical protein YC2023_088659 [Brassica napus]
MRQRRSTTLTDLQNRSDPDLVQIYKNVDASCLDPTTNNLATTPELLSTHSETALVHRIRPQPDDEPEMICKEEERTTDLSRGGGWTRERFGGGDRRVETLRRPPEEETIGAAKRRRVRGREKREKKSLTSL